MMKEGKKMKKVNKDLPTRFNKDTITVSYEKLYKVLDKAEKYENMKKKLSDLIDDLGWEYDGMTEDGKITLNKIAKVMGLPKFTENVGL